MLTQTYILYLAISIAITIWVGKSLNKNGRLFLVENFSGNEAIADSINHLLLVGFYLINIGFICLTLQYGSKPETLDQSIEFLTGKIGWVVLVLGVMHIFNMRALIKFRNFKFVPSL